MGNLQNKGKNSGSSFNVPPDNIFEAINRASREAARLRGENLYTAGGKPNFDSDNESDYDSDDQNEVHESSNKKGKASIRIEPADPNNPWLISSKADLKNEKAKMSALKEKCISNYPGISSTYIDKIKVSIWSLSNTLRFILKMLTSLFSIRI